MGHPRAKLRVLAGLGKGSSLGFPNPLWPGICPAPTRELGKSSQYFCHPEWHSAKVMGTLASTGKRN